MNITSTVRPGGAVNTSNAISGDIVVYVCTVLILRGFWAQLVHPEAAQPEGGHVHIVAQPDKVEAGGSLNP